MTCWGGGRMSIVFSFFFVGPRNIKRSKNQHVKRQFKIVFLSSLCLHFVRLSFSVLKMLTDLILGDKTIGASAV